jgi:hypothetical protein
MHYTGTYQKLNLVASSSWLPRLIGVCIVTVVRFSVQCSEALAQMGHHGMAGVEFRDFKRKFTPEVHSMIFVTL